MIQKIQFIYSLFIFFIGFISADSILRVQNLPNLNFLNSTGAVDLPVERCWNHWTFLSRVRHISRGKCPPCRKSNKRLNLAPLFAAVDYHSSFIGRCIAFVLRAMTSGATFAFTRLASMRQRRTCLAQLEMDSINNLFFFFIIISLLFFKLRWIRSNLERVKDRCWVGVVTSAEHVAGVKSGGQNIIYEIDCWNGTDGGWFVIGNQWSLN